MSHLSDKDLPSCLGSPSKQAKKAKQLLAALFGSPAVRVDNPPIQGMFSKTLFITLKDGRDFVVQFRLDKDKVDPDTFHMARRFLSSVVPDFGELEEDELLVEDGGVAPKAHAYWMTRAPGQIWFRGVAGKGDAGRISICKSLGDVFSEGHMARESAEAVDQVVRAHLEAILASDMEQVAPYMDAIASLAGRVGELARLPLWVAHYDINEVNVLVDDDCRVSGLIDWELSRPLPLVSVLAASTPSRASTPQGEFYMPECFEEAERGFWAALLGGIEEPGVHQAFEGPQANLVQLAVLIGTVCSVFEYHEGKVVGGGVAVKALRKFLTYRVPMIRGKEKAYQI